MIAAGQSPIVEPGLGQTAQEEMVTRKRLRATCSSDEAIPAHGSRAHLCRHPVRRRTASRISRPWQRVAEQIGPAICATASTATPSCCAAPSCRAPRPASCCRRFVPDAVRGNPFDLHVAVKPGFMREGSSLRDFAQSSADARRMRRHRHGQHHCGRSTCASTRRLSRTGIAEAEMTKYVSNTFHALKVCLPTRLAISVTRSAPMRRRSRASF